MLPEGRKNLGGEIDSTSPSSALPLRRDLSYLSTQLYLVARALPCEAISGVLQRPVSTPVYETGMGRDRFNDRYTGYRNGLLENVKTGMEPDRFQ